MVAFLLAGLGLVACGGGQAVEGPGDVRVDHNAPESTVDSEAPVSCLADSGRLYVAWHDDRDGTSGIWFNTSTDGGLTWSAEDVRLDRGTKGAWNPAIACVGDSAWVAWEDIRDGELQNRGIYLSATNDGGATWSAEDVQLDADVDGKAMSLSPQVAAAADGVYVAWFDNRNGAYDIFVRASHDRGASWDPEPVRVDSDPDGAAYSAWPRIAANAEGKVVVAWEDSRQGVSDVYVNYSEDGGRNFGVDTRLRGSGTTGNSFLPTLAMSGDRAHVAWHTEGDDGKRHVLVTSSQDAGAHWTGNLVRLDGETGDSLHPAVGADGPDVYVAWQDKRVGGYDIYLRASHDGGQSWEDEARLDADAQGRAQSYDPVVRVVGTAVVVGWSDRRDDTEGVGFNDLYYTFSQDGGVSWNRNDLRINANEPGTSWSTDASLQLRGSTLVAVWADGRSGSADILAAKRVLGEEGVWVPPEE
ncbi:MAG: hypothetical protein RLZZ299_1935 [Pseudomonadota bacterium]|jgi:hypothetical protein